MGIKNMLSGGRKSQGCVYDTETGQVVCEKKQKHADGTETTLAHISMMHDGGCNAIPLEMSEESDGELDGLKRFATQYTKAKCVKQSRPGDY